MGRDRHVGGNVTGESSRSCARIVGGRHIVLESSGCGACADPRTRPACRVRYWRMCSCRARPRGGCMHRRRRPPALSLPRRDDAALRPAATTPRPTGAAGASDDEVGALNFLGPERGAARRRRRAQRRAPSRSGSRSPRRAATPSGPGAPRRGASRSRTSRPTPRATSAAHGGDEFADDMLLLYLARHDAHRRARAHVVRRRALQRLPGRPRRSAGSSARACCRSRERGIVGRAVLLDIARHRGRRAARARRDVRARGPARRRRARRASRSSATTSCCCGPAGSPASTRTARSSSGRRGASRACSGAPSWSTGSASSRSPRSAPTRSRSRSRIQPGHGDNSVLHGALDAQPRDRLHRDAVARGPGRRLRGRRPSHVPLRGRAAEGGRGLGRADEPARDQVAV